MPVGVACKKAVGVHIAVYGVSLDIRLLGHSQSQYAHYSAVCLLRLGPIYGGSEGTVVIVNQQETTVEKGW